MSLFGFEIKILWFSHLLWLLLIFFRINELILILKNEKNLNSILEFYVFYFSLFLHQFCNPKICMEDISTHRPKKAAKIKLMSN